MYKRIIAFVFSAVLLVSVSACPPPTPAPRPAPHTDDNSAYCDAGCTRLKELECPEGQNLVFHQDCSVTAECTDGICIAGRCTETCKMFCEATIETGRFLGPECWATIDSCDQVESKCR